TAKGMATIALDVPSDHDGGIDEGFRKGADHATDVAAVIAWVRQKVKAPVWLFGTSMGSISASSVAIRLGNAVDGIMLSSSVSALAKNAPGQGVSTLDLDKIAVPALVMDHVDDECRSSPPGNAPGIAKKMTKSPRTAVVMIEGGEQKGDVCGPFS